MTIDEIKQELKRLRKECIEEPDKYFNQLVVEDYEFAMKFEGFEVGDITHSTIYYNDEFWNNHLSDLIDLYEPVLGIEDHDLRTNLFKKLIDIRCVVDAKIKEVNEKKSEYSPKRKHTIRLLKPINKTVEVVIEELHQLLSGYGLIDSDIEHFASHFNPTIKGRAEPIQWYDDNKKLIYLFFQLNEKESKMVSKIMAINNRRTIKQIVQEHFLDQHGSPFLESSIEAEWSKFNTGFFPKKGYPIIEELVNEIRKSYKQ